MSYRTLVMQRPGVVTVAAERPTDSAVRPFFNASKHPAAIACGARIVDLNNAARDREDVFARYALLTTPTAKVVAPDPSQPLHVDVEPSAPSTTTDHDEEPMKTDETPCCDAHECEDPRAGVRADTKPELAGFCRHHRKVAVDRVRDHGVSFAEVAAALREGRSVEAAPSKPARKAPAAKPSKPPQPAKPTKAPKPSNDPGDILFEALRGLRGEQLSEARVREIVREELTTAFTSLRGRA